MADCSKHFFKTMTLIKSLNVKPTSVLSPSNALWSYQKEKNETVYVPVFMNAHLPHKDCLALSPENVFKVTILYHALTTSPSSSWICQMDETKECFQTKTNISCSLTKKSHSVLMSVCIHNQVTLRHFRPFSPRVLGNILLGHRHHILSKNVTKTRSKNKSL